MIRQDKYTLYKANRAIKISNNLTKVEKKFFNHILFISQVDLDISTYKTNANIFDFLIGNKNGQEHKKIKKIFDNLLSKIINIIEPTETEFQKTTYLSSVGLKNGVIDFELSKKIKEYFCIDNKKPKNQIQSYTKLDLNIVNSLNSAHSISLYEIIKSKIFAKNQFTIDLKELKQNLCSDKTYYDEFARFNEKVLKKSIADINKNSDIQVSCDFIKAYDNKTVEKVSFNVKNKIIELEEKNTNPFSEEIKITLDENYKDYPDEVKQLVDIGIKPVSKILSWYKKDKNRLIANLKEVKTKYKDKNNEEKARLIAHLWKVNANVLSKPELEEIEKKKAKEEQIKKIQEYKEDKKNKENEIIRQNTLYLLNKTKNNYNSLSQKEKIELCTKVCRTGIGLNLSKCMENDNYLEFDRLSKLHKNAIMEFMNNGLDIIFQNKIIETI